MLPVHNMMQKDRCLFIGSFLQRKNRAAVCACPLKGDTKGQFSRKMKNVRKCFNKNHQGQRREELEKDLSSYGKSAEGKPGEVEVS